MANLCNTSVSRRAAIHIIRAAAHFSASKNLLNGELLQTYLELNQDPDTSIAYENLVDISMILKDVSIKSAETEFFPEVKFFKII